MIDNFQAGRGPDPNRAMLDQDLDTYFQQKADDSV
jgi:hypothetical protein